jgi:hypothetical protein
VDFILKQEHGPRTASRSILADKGRVKISRDGRKWIGTVTIAGKTHSENLKARDRKSANKKAKVWHQKLIERHAVPYFPWEHQGMLPNTVVPFGLDWGIVAAKGNKKLPFAAYSELPMATCEGAGSCQSYCYSFKALRYPAAFVRQFLNTLANVCDQYFAIDAELARTSGDWDSWDDIMYASQKTNRRWWMTVVKVEILAALKTDLIKNKAKRSYVRLYVDGDHADHEVLYQWMEVIKETDGDALRSHYAQYAEELKESQGLEWYGYSKAWRLFADLVAVNYDWPDNYSLNLSDGSIYNLTKKAYDSAPDNVRRVYDVVNDQTRFPVLRGYFTTVNLQAYSVDLSSALSITEQQYRERMAAYPSLDVPMGMKRIKQFAKLYAVGEGTHDARKAVSQVVNIFFDPRSGVSRSDFERELLSHFNLPALPSTKAIRDSAIRWFGLVTVGGSDTPGSKLKPLPEAAEAIRWGTESSQEVYEYKEDIIVLLTKLPKGEVNKIGKMLNLKDDEHALTKCAKILKMKPADFAKGADLIGPGDKDGRPPTQPAVVVETAIKIAVQSAVIAAAKKTGVADDSRDAAIRAVGSLSIDEFEILQEINSLNDKGVSREDAPRPRSWLGATAVGWAERVWPVRRPQPPSAPKRLRSTSRCCSGRSKRRMVAWSVSMQGSPTR